MGIQPPISLVKRGHRDTTDSSTSSTPPHHIQQAIMSDITIWGIHAGKTGDADTLFLKKHLIGLGWTKVGDLSSLPADREAFKARVAESYPEKKP